jgi:hypothetical protein
MPQNVKVVSAALDEFDEGEIILRGVVDPGSLELLQVGEYQREKGTEAQIHKLMKALVDSNVPDIELGCRGGHYSEREDAVFIRDPVYVVDGYQRVTAALRLMAEDASFRPRLGATVHFNTTEDWERERFRILNAERVKVSQNILIRNKRREIPVVEALYNLTHDRSFVLGHRVCWTQRARREELVSATTLVKVAGRLHTHLGPTRSYSVDHLISGLQQVMTRIGRNTFRDNIKTFFNLVDSCWGINSIEFKEGAVYMRSTFLETLARMLSNHEIFWRDNKLFVERPLVRKIQSFPVMRDPHVGNLSSAGGKASDILYQLLVDHVNSGKRNNRLTPRNGAAA